MYKNKTPQGKNNLCGKNIKMLRLRMDPPLSQRALADRMQIAGLDIDKNVIQRIESGARFVTDIELRLFAKVLDVTSDELLNE